MEFIYDQFYRGVKKLGNLNQSFITRISGLFMCLIRSLLYDGLECYESGEYVASDDFNYKNSNGK